MSYAQGRPTNFGRPQRTSIASSPLPPFLLRAPTLQLNLRTKWQRASDGLSPSRSCADLFSYTRAETFFTKILQNPPYHTRRGLATSPPRSYTTSFLQRFPSFFVKQNLMLVRMRRDNGWRARTHTKGRAATY